MSYEERRKKRLRNRKIKRIIVICFLGLLIFRSISGVLAKNANTILVEEDTLVNTKDAQGALIMEETIFTTMDNAIIEDINLEGKRVPAGYKVAEVNLLTDVSSLKEELLRIEETIDVLSRSDRENEILEKDKKDINSEQKKLIEDLKSKIHAGDYSDIDKIKTALEKGDNKITEILPNNTLINQSLESLNNRRDNLLESISKNILSYTAPMAGMLSYEIDGYEKLFIPQEFENYTYENLNIPKNLKKKDKKPNTNGFKIINNFEWYVALKIDDSDKMKTYEKGNIITLDFKNDKDKIKGKVVSVNESKEKMVIVVKITTNLEDYYDERFPDVSIIMSKQDVYKLPTKAVIEKEGQTGVYIKELNGIVKFKPLSIVEESKDYTYIDKGDEKGYIEIKGHENPVKTITLYDEIFINPSKIKEGQILD